jgi:tetratricopeptide (TPR) repeat protein
VAKEWGVKSDSLNASNGGACDCRYGDLLMQQGRHEEAQDYYRSALKADPENRENLERYASFLASHDMDDALFYYQVSKANLHGQAICIRSLQ